MEWTREKTLSLISEYKKRRGLWDMTHEDYRKKEMKQKLLMEVSVSLGGGIPIVEIEKKFHTLRTQYHREINRMKRKEPYNSKWFGFKNLQFLSSPKAMRASKGKIKAEITEDGVTKYVIRDATSRDSEPSPAAVAAATSTITTEFLTIHRSKPPTISYETTPTSAPTVVPVPRAQKFESTRARDLEKLIEETTKDVEEPEDSKPKMIKEISLPLQHHSYSTNPLVTQDDADHQSQQQQQQQQHHHHQHQHQEQHIEEEHLGTIDIQTSVEEENISYHHHNAPRLFKIQRRDTCNEEDYYEEEQQQQQHIQAKRMYYETTNGGAPAITSSPSGMAVTKLQQPPQPVRFRDDFATYGEYVANEMRTISNREILISLKHKINTALFEASMAELQQK